MPIALKKNTTRMFVLCGLFCLQNISAKAQKINLDALDAYWKITRQLRQGDTVSKVAWKDFLNMDGNRQYVVNQAFDDKFIEYYRKAMEIVYMPKYAVKLKKMMEHKFDYWVIYKINQYQENEVALKEYATHLKEVSYLDSMYANNWKWLPKRLQTRSPETKIFFIGIDNDALVEKGTIIFTLWSAYNQDKLKYGILGGHELHHVLRKPFDFAAVQPEDEGILYVLNAVLNEGSGDMIDKKYGLEHLDKVPVEYDYSELLLTKPDSIVKQIDTCLRSMSKSNGKVYRTIKQYRKLMNQSSGHNPGYYMADIIVRNGYRKELIENVQNPFYFIYLYNKAAKKDSNHPPVFSASGLEYVKLMEKKYWRSRMQ